MALPLDRQIRFGVGTICDYSESLTLAFNLEFADLGRAQIKDDFVCGSYDTNTRFLFGINLDWKKLPGPTGASSRTRPRSESLARHLPDRTGGTNGDTPRWAQ